MGKSGAGTEKIDVFEPYEIRRERNRATREKSLAAARAALNATLKANGLPAGHGVVNFPPLNPSWMAPHRVSARSRASQDFTPQVRPKTSRGAAGNTYYGGPCKRHPGHNLRYSSNGDCTLCAKARSRGLLTPGQARAAGVRVTGIWQSIEIRDSARTVGGFACVVCGNPFTPAARVRRPPLYCSGACAMVAHRRRASTTKGTVNHESGARPA